MTYCIHCTELGNHLGLFCSSRKTFGHSSLSFYPSDIYESIHFAETPDASGGNG